MSESVAGVVEDESAGLAVKGSQATTDLLYPESKTCGGPETNPDFNSRTVEPFRYKVTRCEYIDRSLFELSHSPLAVMRWHTAVDVKRAYSRSIELCRNMPRVVNRDAEHHRPLTRSEALVVRYRIARNAGLVRSLGKLLVDELTHARV